MPKKFRKKDAERIKEEKELQYLEELYERADFLVSVMQGTIDQEEITDAKILHAFGDTFDREKFEADAMGEVAKKFSELNLESATLSSKRFKKEDLIKLLDPQDEFKRKFYEQRKTPELREMYLKKLKES